MFDTQRDLYECSDEIEEEPTELGNWNRKRPSPLQLVKPEIWTVTVDSYFLGEKMLTVDHDHETKRCNGSVEGQRKKHFGAILVESLTGPEHTIPEPVPKNVSFHVYRPSPLLPLFVCSTGK